MDLHCTFIDGPKAGQTISLPWDHGKYLTLTQFVGSLADVSIEETLPVLHHKYELRPKYPDSTSPEKARIIDLVYAGVDL